MSINFDTDKRVLEWPNRPSRWLDDEQIFTLQQHLKLGRWPYIHANAQLDYSGGLEIGDLCVITSQVIILTHDASAMVFGQLPVKAPVKLGHNVFIGVRSVILPRVTIGNNVIIGAMSVVTEDIPNNSVVAGNPAQMIKAHTSPTV